MPRPYCSTTSSTSVIGPSAMLCLHATTPCAGQWLLLRCAHSTGCKQSARVPQQQQNDLLLPLALGYAHPSAFCFTGQCSRCHVLAWVFDDPSHLLNDLLLLPLRTPTPRAGLRLLLRCRSLQSMLLPCQLQSPAKRPAPAAPAHLSRARRAATEPALRILPTFPAPAVTPLTTIASACMCMRTV